MTEKNIGVKLSELIWEHYPKIKTCDREDCMKAAAVVANILGCLVATLSAHYEHDEIMEGVVAIIEKESSAVEAKAWADVQNSGHA